MVSPMQNRKLIITPSYAAYSGAISSFFQIKNPKTQSEVDVNIESVEEEVKVESVKTEEPPKIIIVKVPLKEQRTQIIQSEWYTSLMTRLEESIVSGDTLIDRGSVSIEIVKELFDNVRTLFEHAKINKGNSTNN